MNICKNIKFLAALLCMMCTLASCYNDNNLGNSYYTFTGETMNDYLKNRPDTFSLFYQLVQDVKAVDLLSTYGTYTCFAPTNAAVKAYMEQHGGEIGQKAKEDLVYGHLIPKTYLFSVLGGGALDVANLDNRFITTKIDAQSHILVNGSSAIIRSNEVVNGVVHTVNAVLSMPNTQLPELIAENSRFSLFHEALTATGLADSLRLIEDNSFVQTTSLDIYNKKTVYSPKTLKYGYTALVESNDVFAKNGITDLAGLKAYAATVYDAMYPDDKDVSAVTDRRNSLNRFIAYHLIDKMIYNNGFIYDNNAVLQSTMYEYFETMCPNTLLQAQSVVTTAGSGTSDPAFNKLNDGTAIHIVTDNIDNEATLNGIYHEINSILVYSPKVEGMLKGKRLRFDSSSFFSELTNNNVRGSKETEQILIPQGYFKKLSFTSASRVFYLWPSINWCNYQGDEFNIVGVYDFTVTLPPVPAGTYEVRFGYTTNPSRGVAQLYFDGEAVGIPLDLTIADTSDPRIGWVADSRTTDNGVANDKAMRNRGYMKGPVTFGNKTDIARNNANSLRRILGVFSFTKAGIHTLRARSVNTKNMLSQFHFDYLEFVPKQMIEDGEGRD